MNNSANYNVFNKVDMKKVGVTLATVLMASLLTACGGGSSSSSTDTGGTGGTGGTPTVVNGYTLLKADGSNAANINEAACVKKGSLTWQMPMTTNIYQYGDDVSGARGKVSTYVSGFGSLCGKSGWRLPSAAELQGTILSDAATGAVLQDATTNLVFDSAVFKDVTATLVTFAPFCTASQTAGVSMVTKGGLVADQTFNPTTEPGWTADTYPCYIRMVNGTAAP